MLQKKQGQTDPLYKIFRVCDGLGTQGRTKEFLCKKKKSLLYGEVFYRAKAMMQVS